MKEFNLGDRVFVERYYKRNHIKPRKNSESYSRYDLEPLNKIGIYCGKRNIHISGYTEESYYAGLEFNSLETKQVHLVALSHKQLIYVPDEQIRRVG